MSNWYRTGTANVTNGSAAIVGTGTYWASAANKPEIGDIFTDNAKIYEIIGVADDDNLTLDRTYEGSNDAALAYAIILTASGTTNTRLTSQVTGVLDKLGDRVTVSTTAPSAGQGRDGDVWIVAV